MLESTNPGISRINHKYVPHPTGRANFLELENVTVMTGRHYYAVGLLVMATSFFMVVSNHHVP